ncbi:MAG: type 1 glutamine amidotransferase [Candidatus Actinomarinales bacterium]|nr:MAG: type 1 glutamine amidotransferase [Candidatus Actinomarinales bacterium]
MNKSTIAIINDSEVTAGSLPNNIISINAWDINWDDLSLDDNYIILGGHMGSYDDQKFTYLQEEKEWLKYAINSNAKILGICLGSQLIADAMGGAAFLSKNIEFGFKNLEFLVDDSLFDDFKNTKVFSWHRDTFNIPPEATLIAKTEYPQIYSIKNSLALQFHPEIKLDLFENWYDSDLSKEELANYDIYSELNYLKDNSQQLEKTMLNFYNKWISFKN